MEWINISVKLNASAEKVYKAWLSSKEHTAFTGDEAVISSKKGAKFSAFSGYIKGRTVDLIPHQVIVQRWRTTEFDSKDPDSLLTLFIKPEANERCTLTLVHTNIPGGQGKKYKDGWMEYYIRPMKEYFSS